jgi:hypothetical protein
MKTKDFNDIWTNPCNSCYLNEIKQKKHQFIPNMLSVDQVGFYEEELFKYEYQHLCICEQYRKQAATMKKLTANQ